MAIRIRNEVVTRQERRMQCRAKEATNPTVLRDKRLDRAARKHLKESGIEKMTHEALDGIITKAFIRTLHSKPWKGLPSHADMQLAHGLNIATQRYIKLADSVTDYVTQDWNGIIWGNDLDELYAEIALAERIAHEFPGVTGKDVKYAVDIAVSENRLHRQEANTVVIEVAV